MAAYSPGREQPIANESDAEVSATAPIERIAKIRL